MAVCALCAQFGSSDDRQVFIHGSWAELSPGTNRFVVRKFLTWLWLSTRMNRVPLTKLNWARLVVKEVWRSFIADLASCSCKYKALLIVVLEYLIHHQLFLTNYTWLLDNSVSQQGDIYQERSYWFSCNFCLLWFKLCPSYFIFPVSYIMLKWMMKDWIIYVAELKCSRILSWIQSIQGCWSMGSLFPFI